MAFQFWFSDPNFIYCFQIFAYYKQTLDIDFLFRACQLEAFLNFVRMPNKNDCINLFRYFCSPYVNFKIRQFFVQFCNKPKIRLGRNIIGYSIYVVLYLIK